jgi:hypothetical protein
MPFETPPALSVDTSQARDKLPYICVALAKVKKCFLSLRQTGLLSAEGKNVFQLPGVNPETKNQFNIKPI